MKQHQKICSKAPCKILWKCNYCSNYFSRKGTVKQHIKKIHPGLKIPDELQSITVPNNNPNKCTDYGTSNHDPMNVE